MEKQYRIQKDNLKEALDEIEQFEESMKKFMENYSGYKYSIDMQQGTEDTSRWVVDLNITKHEQINNKVT